MRSRPLFLLLLFALGCGTRDHVNPLDPDNPDTGGRPEWLTALADDRAVDLAWEVPSFADLAEVRLARSGDGAILWRGADGAGAFRDAPAANGVERAYHLELALTSGKVRALDDRAATPGRAVPWVLDTGSGRARRLTPDGRAVRLSAAAGAAVSLEADPDSGSVVLAEFYSGTVRKLDREGAPVWTRSDFFRPVVARHAAGGWWIGDTGLGSVVLLDDRGRTLAVDTTFTFPVDIAVGADGPVWVADRAGEAVRLRAGVGRVAAAALSTPVAVSANGDGGAWVATGGEGLVRLDANGNELARRSGMEGVVGLAADPVVEAGVWAADRKNRMVVLVDGEGEAVAVLPASVPSAIAVSPDGSEVWLADNALGVVRYSREGEELSRVRGVTVPTSVSVAFRPAGR